MQINSYISHNFEIGKVIAILVVVCGHFIPPSPFWVVVSVALSLFAFSSGYFTALIYGPSPNLLSFWRNKFLRLGPNLVAINLILLTIFIIQNRPNILHWHSILGILGLSGWLNWLHLPNVSPFGAGLWYFSLLLLFYALYPLLTKLLCAGITGKAASFALLLITLYLSEKIKYGHMLWLTAFCFSFGVVFANQQWKAGWKNTLHLSSALMLAFLLGSIFFSAPTKSLIVITFASLCSIQILLTAALPNWLYSPLKPISACVLEIYFLHSYLFIHPSGLIVIDLLASLGLILSLSIITKLLADQIRKKILH